MKTPSCGPFKVGRKPESISRQGKTSVFNWNSSPTRHRSSSGDTGRLLPYARCHFRRSGFAFQKRGDSLGLARKLLEAYRRLQRPTSHARRCYGRARGRAFIARRRELEPIQLLQTHSLGEHAIRPAMLALRILHECRVLLATALPNANGHRPGYLRLLISHAKVDGLPLAHALKHQIEATRWLEKFYDVDDLPAGLNWQRELERGVGSSLIIMLRTEAYDGRHWCRQEVLWADEYATPAVLVDARTNLNHPAGILPFERLPTVRIPDGNLSRILFWRFVRACVSFTSLDASRK